MLLALLSSMLLVNCSRTPNKKLDDMVSADGQLLRSGSFKGLGSQKVSGLAKIYLTNGQYQLKTENFSTTNGPDLKVYLSKGATPQEFISLGSLKSTNGNQVYPINGSPDFSIYRFVLIHCEKYNHLYGNAELMQ